MVEFDGDEPTYSISTRLQRVTEYEAYVSVPVTPAVMQDEPDANGSYRIDPEKLWAEAVRLGQETDDWRPTDTRVMPHPIQKAPDHVEERLAAGDGSNVQG